MYHPCPACDVDAFPGLRPTTFCHAPIALEVTRSGPKMDKLSVTWITPKRGPATVHYGIGGPMDIRSIRRKKQRRTGATTR